MSAASSAPHRASQRLGAHRAEAAALSVQLPLVQSGQQLRRAPPAGRSAAARSPLRLYAVQRGSSPLPRPPGAGSGALSRRVFPLGKGGTRHTCNLRRVLSIGRAALRRHWQSPVPSAVSGGSVVLLCTGSSSVPAAEAAPATGASPEPADSSDHWARSGTAATFPDAPRPGRSAP